MITASDISLSYGTQVLFKHVNIKFTPGNCYGIIGRKGDCPEITVRESGVATHHPAHGIRPTGGA